MAKATWWIKVIILFLFWTNLISNLSKCYLPDKIYTGKNVMFVVYLKIRKFSQGSKEQTSSQVESRSKPITWLDISLYFVRLGCFDYAHLVYQELFSLPFCFTWQVRANIHQIQILTWKPILVRNSAALGPQKFLGKVDIQQHDSHNKRAWFLKRYLILKTANVNKLVRLLIGTSLLPSSPHRSLYDWLFIQKILM